MILFKCSCLDSANAVNRIINSFGCEIPTSIQHSILSIVNEHTLKVRCQKGYEFGGSDNFSTNRSKRKIRFVQCRNSVIINNVLPRCIPNGNSLHRHQHGVKSKRVKSLLEDTNSHSRTWKEDHNELSGYKNAKHTKGLK